MGRLTLSTACPARSLQVADTRYARAKKKEEFEDAVMALWSKNASQEQLRDAWARKQRREQMQRKLNQVEARLQNGMDEDRWQERDDDDGDDSTVDSDEDLTLIEEIGEIFEDIFGAFSSAVASITDEVETERKTERGVTKAGASNKAKSKNGSPKATLELESIRKKNRSLGLDKLLKKLAKEEEKLEREERNVMETRRQIRAAAAAVNMQCILDDYDDYDDDEIGERIREAFSDLGSVSSVAQDVIEINSRLYKSAEKQMNKAIFPHG